MKRFLFRGFLIGLTAGIGLMAVAYLGQQWFGLPFFPDDIFEWQARHLPGSVLTLFIGLMVKTISGLHLGATDVVAKQVERGTGFLQFAIGAGLFGLIAAAIARRFKRRAMTVSLLVSAVAGLVVFLVERSLGIPPPGTIVAIFWIAVLFLGWGWVLGTWLRDELKPAEIIQADPTFNARRRAFFTWLGGGVLALIVAALGLGRIGKSSSPSVSTTGSATEVVNSDEIGATSGPAASPPVDVLNQRIPVVPGTRDELTPTAKFYRIDIDSDVPQIDPNTWRLSITGLVDRELTLSLDQIKAMPSQGQVITQECISNYVGGDLISTSRYVGVPLKQVLAQAGVKSDAQYIHMNSVDGYYESMPLAEADDERTLLVYQINNDPLPPEHGAPLRIYIPGHYGMKMPKWLEHMTLANVDGPGFWVDRGWTKQAIPYTTSVIDTVVEVTPSGAAQRKLAVGGVAYSGARGISKVEVQVDDGPWQAGQLRVPPLSALSWVQWRYDQDYVSGRHTFRVRSYDGKGQLQETSSQDPEPLGASGIHSFPMMLP